MVQFLLVILWAVATTGVTLWVGTSFFARQDVGEEVDAPGQRVKHWSGEGPPDEVVDRLRHILNDPRADGDFASFLPKEELSEFRAVVNLIDLDLKHHERRQVSKPAPQSRVILLYLAHSKEQKASEQMAEEVLSFWASWSWMFNGVTDFGSAFGIDNKWLPEFPDPPKEGPGQMPVNDLLIVSDPEVPFHLLPPKCKHVYPLGAFDLPIMIATLDVRGRIRTARSRCFIFFTGLFNQHHPLIQEYKRLNSNTVLTESTIQNLLLQYDLMIRVDNDAFVAPGLVLSKPPWEAVIKDEDGERKKVVHEFAFSPGGYAVATNNELRDDWRAALGLRTANVTNVGEAFYGRPIDIIATGRLSSQMIKFLLYADPLFLIGGGVWPKWWRGTSLMYSREIAVNHVVDPDAIRKIPNYLDVDAAKPTINVFDTEKPVAGVHCWHSRAYFSKFDWKADAYNEAQILTGPDFQFSSVSDYAFTFSVIGRRLRQLRAKLPEYMKPYPARAEWAAKEIYALMEKKEQYVLKNGEAPLPHGVMLADYGQPKEEYFPFVSERSKRTTIALMQCPRNFPHAYGSGPFSCCDVAFDCNDSPLNKTSRCCKGSFVQCPASIKLGCRDWDGLTDPEAAKLDDTMAKQMPFSNNKGQIAAPALKGEKPLQGAAVVGAPAQVAM